jgi:hypothetical protein
VSGLADEVARGRGDREVIDRFASVFIPSLGWFQLKPGSTVAELLADVAGAQSSECVASGKLTFELEVVE